jgi:hypothetical protein
MRGLDCEGSFDMLSDLDFCVTQKAHGCVEKCVPSCATYRNLFMWGIPARLMMCWTGRGKLGKELGRDVRDTCENVCGRQVEFAT